jgi:hypothetical protein
MAFRINNNNINISTSASCNNKIYKEEDIEIINKKYNEIRNTSNLKDYKKMDYKKQTIIYDINIGRWKMIDN